MTDKFKLQSLAARETVLPAIEKSWQNVRILQSYGVPVTLVLLQQSGVWSRVKLTWM